MTSEDDYNELCYYTLAHRDPSFIHQHVVDAFAAQHADEKTKPIKLTFALVGLYLHVEKQFSGKRVQQVHMDLARQKRPWPSFALPSKRGSQTAADVLAVTETRLGIAAQFDSIGAMNQELTVIRRQEILLAVVTAQDQPVCLAASGQLTKIADSALNTIFADFTSVEPYY
jgi:hypothetical protein